MKGSLKLKMASAIVLGSLYTACQPNTNNGAAVNTNLKMTGSSKAATVAQSGGGLLGLIFNKAYAFISPSLVDSNANNINLTTAWVVVKEIEFEAEEIGSEDEVDGDEISFSGPYFVDLLSNSPTALDTQNIPANSYKRIKMKFHSSSTNLPPEAPADLANNSILLQGTVGANNFTFQLDDSTEVNIGGANPILPANGASLMVEINFANIFKQIDMSSVINDEVIDHNNRHAGSNLCSSIDASANDLYTCIRKGLEVHAKFGEDSDGNDDLDETEDVELD